MCLYQISSSPWPNMACHRPPRSLSNNQNFKSWMPRIYRYIYLFLTIKSLIQTYFLTVYFLKLCSFATPIPINCVSCRILSLLSSLDVFFSDKPHTDFCGLSPQVLPFGWAGLGPQVTCPSRLTLTLLVFVSSFTLSSFPSPVWKQTQENPNFRI